MLFWQGRNKCSIWLISAGAVSRGATTGQLLEDEDSDCVWPPLGDAKELEGRELDWPCEYLTGMLSGFKLEHSCSPQHTHHVVFVFIQFYLIRPLHFSVLADNIKGPFSPPQQGKDYVSGLPLGGWRGRDCGCMYVQVCVYISRDRAGFPTDAHGHRL